VLPTNTTPTEPASLVISTRIRMANEAVRVGAPTVHPTHGEPKIQLVREEGVVRAIDITCGCGEKIRVRCDYFESP
jgi:hypothetical protein